MKLLALALLLAALIAGPSHGHDARHDERLPVVGMAPDFTLISQDDKPVSLRDFRGKAVAIAFIFTSCMDVCPMLTSNMALVRDKLGSLFGSRIVFISITVDPERDTPQVLKQYAADFDAEPAGWSFLTGDPATVRNIARQYGVISMRTDSGDIDHTLLTSLVDSKGALRVQYLGAGFDLEEFRGDLLSLLDEAR
jgi:protein SCO1/2